MRHQHISWIKSIIRIVGYLVLVVSVPYGALVLIGSEILGIAEEIGHD